MALVKIDEIRHDGRLYGERYGGKAFSAVLSSYGASLRNGGEARVDIPRHAFSYVQEGIERWKGRDKRWESERLMSGRLELILHSKSLGIRTESGTVFFDRDGAEHVLDALFLASAREQLYDG